MSASEEAAWPFTTAETHLSWLVFVQDRVYKVKKPLSTEFVDLSTHAARLHDAQEEVRLNRRMAPDVYLGVARLSGVPGLDAPVVVMRRLPEQRRLATMAARGDDLDQPVRHLARLLAAFHADVPVVPGAGGRSEVLDQWEAGRVQLHSHARGILDVDEVDRVAAAAARYVRGRPGLFEGRADRVRDGHGDLLADDVFLLDDGPRVLDCLEFDAGLRACDTLADVAFLAMDLERVGRCDLAVALVSEHRRASCDTWPPSLAHHWTGYRAWVRTKVGCLRAEQGDEGAAWQARQLLELAARHVGRARVRLVLVGGTPGTGKSVLAGALARRTGWDVLRSDVVRKELAGLPPTAPAPARPGEGLYAPSVSERTLRELLRRARPLLQDGQSVVLDATWSRRDARAAAAALADETCSELAELRTVVADDVADARTADRAGGPSDATPGIARWLRARFEPWPSATRLTTDLAPDELVDRLAPSLGLEGDQGPWYGQVADDNGVGSAPARP